MIDMGVLKYFCSNPISEIVDNKYFKIRCLYSQILEGGDFTG